MIVVVEAKMRDLISIGDAPMVCLILHSYFITGKVTNPVENVILDFQA